MGSEGSLTPPANSTTTHKVDEDTETLCVRCFEYIFSNHLEESCDQTTTKTTCSRCTKDHQPCHGFPEEMQDQAKELASTHAAYLTVKKAIIRNAMVPGMLELSEGLKTSYTAFVAAAVPAPKRGPEMAELASKGLHGTLELSEDEKVALDKIRSELQGMKEVMQANYEVNKEIAKSIATLNNTLSDLKTAGGFGNSQYPGSSFMSGNTSPFSPMRVFQGPPFSLENRPSVSNDLGPIAKLPVEQSETQPAKRPAEQSETPAAKRQAREPSKEITSVAKEAN